ncbi:MAG: hypothetical protein KAW01_02860 [Deltaproteobacteria bacterium]|nr:hypothetical protein [Deltaproteobacteria bacterium]
MIRKTWNIFHLSLVLLTLLFLHIGSLDSQAYDIQEYLPLNVGDVRLYLESWTENGQVKWELSREPITRAVDIGGTEVFIQGGLSGDCGGEEYEALAWDSDGLKLYREVESLDGNESTLNFSPPALLAPKQLETGETKKWTVKEGDEIIALEMTLEAVESITVFPGTVLARTFDNCLRMRWHEKSGEESEECRAWYAKDIGMVKEECTLTEDGETSTETTDLVAAVVDHSLYGSPLRTWQGEWFSFYLAHISTEGCDMVMNNVVIALPGETPELWWLRFRLNLDASPVAWIITDFGQGTPPSLDASSTTACPIAGLDFSQALYKININDLTLDPQLWLRFPFEGNDYMLGFLFPPAKFSWDFHFINLLQ